MAQSGFTDVSVSGSYGFVEASVGVSTSSSSQSTSSKSSTSAVANWKLKRVMIALDPKSPSFPFKPNPEFLAAVQAIDGKNIPEADKFIEYKGLTTYWGQVLPLKIELGGKLTTSFKLTQSSQSSASETSLKISAEVGVNLGRLSAKVGVSTGNTQSSAQSSSNYLGSSSWTAVGGATGLVSGAISASGDLSGFGEWARSVDESFKSWAVTARDTFIPIHQLLPDSLQTKVLAWNKAHAARYPPSPPGGFEKWVILTGWCATGYLLGRPTDIRTWENGDGIYNFGKTGSDDECKALCEVDPVCWAFCEYFLSRSKWGGEKSCVLISSIRRQHGSCLVITSGRNSVPVERHGSTLLRIKSGMWEVSFRPVRACTFPVTSSIVTSSKGLTRATSIPQLEPEPRHTFSATFSTVLAPKLDPVPAELA